MTRSLMRLLLATFVAIALVAGFSSGSAVAAGAAQRADVTEPTEACQAEYDTFIVSATAFNAKTKQVQRDNRKVNRTQAKVDRASTMKQKKKARKQLRQAKRAQRTHTAQQGRIRERAIADYTTWQSCEEAAAEEPTEPTPPVSPIQALCTAGVPQEVCDAFSTIPLPTPGEGGTGDSPIQALCDAGAPQVLCDAASLPGTDGESPLQPLCDLGLPEIFCTTPGDGPLDPLDPILDPVCGLLPLPGLCP